MPGPSITMSADWNGAAGALDTNATDTAGWITVIPHGTQDGKQGATITLTFGTAFTRRPYVWVNCASFLGTTVPLSYVAKTDSIIMTILETPWHGTAGYNLYYYALDSSVPPG